MNKQKPTAILFGDYSAPKYHPFTDIDQLLGNLLAPHMTTTCTEDRSMFEYQKLSGFDLCISYVDAWERTLTPSQISGLITFIAQGGGLLAIHNGISYQNNPEFAQLLGAKFTGHPPYQILKYRIELVPHPITKGIADFEMEEELYLFDVDPCADTTLLMECSGGGMTSPAAWVRSYGLGRIVYLAPGHNINSFKHSVYQQLIVQSALWAAKII